MNIKHPLMIAVLATTLSGAALADPYPVTVVDDLSRVVTFTEKPKNIASVSIFAADIMKKFGGKVVASSTFGGEMPKYLGDVMDDVVDIGSRSEANLELMRAANVDLTIAIRRYTEAHADEFEEIGKYLAYDTISYQDSERAVASAAMALGFGDEGVSLNEDFTELVDEMNDKAPGGVSALFVWNWEDTLYGYYDHYMTVSLQKALNADNPFGASPTPHTNKPFGGPISYEELLSYDPDVLFIFRSPGQDVASHPVYERLKAFKNNRIWRVKHQYPEVHGPIARELVLKEMAHLLYPDTFPKPEMPEGAQATPVVFKK